MVSGGDGDGRWWWSTMVVAMGFGLADLPVPQGPHRAPITPQIRLCLVVTNAKNVASTPFLLPPYPSTQSMSMPIPCGSLDPIVVLQVVR